LHRIKVLAAVDVERFITRVIKSDAVITTRPIAG